MNDFTIDELKELRDCIEWKLLQGNPTEITLPVKCKIQYIIDNYLLIEKKKNDFSTNAEEIKQLHLFSRALSDVWYFGILLESGKTIAISQINDITKDGLGNAWLDAELLEESPIGFHDDVIVSATSRTRCIINCSKIVMIQELADT